MTEDNLIDLGPGSPAVVSPMVGSTAPPSSLSSQLAGLGECPRVRKVLYLTGLLMDIFLFVRQSDRPFGAVHVKGWVFLSLSQMHHLLLIISFLRFKVRPLLESRSGGSFEDANCLLSKRQVTCHVLSGIFFVLEMIYFHY